MIAIYDFKRGHLVRRVHVAVEDKLGGGEEGDPVIMFRVSE